MDSNSDFVCNSRYGLYIWDRGYPGLYFRLLLCRGWRRQWPLLPFYLPGRQLGSSHRRLARLRQLRQQDSYQLHGHPALQCRSAQRVRAHPGDPRQGHLLPCQKHRHTLEGCGCPGGGTLPGRHWWPRVRWRSFIPPSPEGDIRVHASGWSLH